MNKKAERTITHVVLNENFLEEVVKRSYLKAKKAEKSNEKLTPNFIKNEIWNITKTMYKGMSNKKLNNINDFLNSLLQQINQEKLSSKEEIVADDYKNKTYNLFFKFLKATIKDKKNEDINEVLQKIYTHLEKNNKDN